MGKVMSRLNRQMYRFNAENRAERIISKEKPIPAPRHPSTLKHLDKLTQDVDITAMGKKNLELDEHLKKVFVTSFDPPPRQFDKGQKPSEKARLPVDRTASQDLQFGHVEPENVPEGKITLREVLNLLKKREEDPIKYDENSLAKLYKLSLDDTVNILTYFAHFKLYIAEPTKGKEKIYGKVMKMMTQELNVGKDVKVLEGKKEELH